jgi:hypothetical protein
MEIEFNPSQLPASRASNPVKGVPAGPASVSQTPSLQGAAELQSKLYELALTRPDKMNAVQPAIADVQYPPDELLNGIAHLLAIHLAQ